ncbi:MAG: hypothetical protein N3E37_01425 [Candidatus Micrarchaeota archaeon]|nr:hypothetical protein [Candidatus Micrarchaeota archaeon]
MDSSELILSLLIASIVSLILINSLKNYIKTLDYQAINKLNHECELVLFSKTNANIGIKHNVLSKIIELEEENKKYLILGNMSCRIN